MSMNESVFTVLLGISNISLAAAFIVSLILSRREREDLYNRMMSANIGDYVRLCEKDEPKRDVRLSAHKRAIARFHAKGTGMKPE